MRNSGASFISSSACANLLAGIKSWCKVLHRARFDGNTEEEYCWVLSVERATEISCKTVRIGI